MSLKIIYLDDEVSLLELFSDLFSSDDIKIHTFSSPQDAIAHAKAQPPDLFFMDYRLPGTNGDEVSLEIDPSVPRVLITGDLFTDLKVPYFSVLPKPFDPEDIRKIIAYFKSSR